MTKAEFLDRLKVALNGKISASLLGENMTYYSEYIDTQIYMGRSEQEVMDMLGDPRLIARTIIQTNGTETVEEASCRENTSHDDMSYGSTEYDNPYNYSGGNEIKVRTIPGWLWTVIAVVIIVCLIRVVSFLLPLILPVLIILFFVKLFRDWLN